MHSLPENPVHLWTLHHLSTLLLMMWASFPSAAARGLNNHWTHSLFTRSCFIVLWQCQAKIWRQCDIWSLSDLQQMHSGGHLNVSLYTTWPQLFLKGHLWCGREAASIAHSSRGAAKHACWLSYERFPLLFQRNWSPHHVENPTFTKLEMQGKYSS